MSELDKIKECLDFFCRRCNEQGFYSPPLQPIVKEAYEAIAALRSEPWIPVGERLPEVSGWQFLLVWDKKELEPFVYKWVAGDTSFAGTAITHWMPLPAAPSRETAKPEAEPALSAEQIDEFCAWLLESLPKDWPPSWVEPLHQIKATALSSLTARDEYMDLIMQVGRKYPGETRHQTAKRYIMQAESSSNSALGQTSQRSQP